jgi:hypothetical protein
MKCGIERYQKEKNKKKKTKRERSSYENFWVITKKFE